MITILKTFINELMLNQFILSCFKSWMDCQIDSTLNQKIVNQFSKITNLQFKIHFKFYFFTKWFTYIFTNFVYELIDTIKNSFCKTCFVKIYFEINSLVCLEKPIYFSNILRKTRVHFYLDPNLKLNRIIFEWGPLAPQLINFQPT